MMILSWSMFTETDIILIYKGILVIYHYPYLFSRELINFIKRISQACWNAQCNGHFLFQAFRLSTVRLQTSAMRTYSIYLLFSKLIGFKCSCVEKLVVEYDFGRSTNDVSQFFSMLVNG